MPCNISYLSSFHSLAYSALIYHPKNIFLNSFHVQPYLLWCPHAVYHFHRKDTFPPGRYGFYIHPFYPRDNNNAVYCLLIPLGYGSGTSSKICSFEYKILFSSFIPPFLRKYEKSPSPVGEGLYLQPTHLYTTYRSVVNFLCTNMLTSTKWKINRTIH